MRQVRGSLNPQWSCSLSAGEGGGAGVGDVGDPRIVDGLGREVGRVVPGAAGGLEQLVVAGDDGLVLPEALGVVLGRVDELLGTRRRSGGGRSRAGRG